MEPNVARLIAQAYVRDSHLTAALRQIVEQQGAESQAGRIAAQALAVAPPVVPPPGDAEPPPAISHPIERLLAAFARLYVAAELMTDLSRNPQEVLQARGILRLAVMIAKAEASDLLPVEGMDALALACTLNRQNDAFRASLHAAREVVQQLVPGGQRQREMKARLLRQIAAALALHNPVAEVFSAWPKGEVVPFLQAVPAGQEKEQG